MGSAAARIAWLAIAVLALAAAERRGAAEDFGPQLQGTQPPAGVHVTRLHRYEHSGLAAMLQAEALWSMEGADGRATAGGLQARRSGAEPRTKGSKRRFVQMSARQVEALQDHHRLMLVQVSGNARGMGRMVEGSAESSRESSAATLRTARRHRSIPVPEGRPAVTRLSNLDSQYVGPIGVGTTVLPQGCLPPQGKSLIFLPSAEDGTSSTVERRSCHLQDQSHVWVVLDTGSTNIWVNSDLCDMGACAKPGRQRYNHTQSTTYTSPKDRIVLNIEFGTGKVSGPQAVDDFHVGPFSVYNQTFGMIEVQEGKVFEEVPFEGILGLAFPKMSANGVTPFFDNIIQQRALQRNEFSFYFSLDNPAANAVFWGGAHPGFYTGELEYFRVTDPYYWSLPLVSFQIGGKELFGAKTLAGGKEQRRPRAIVDTGTTFFTAEGQLFDEVMRRLPAAPCSQITEASHPPLTYRLQNAAGQPTDFVLNSTQYMTASGAGERVCSPAFMRIDIPARHGPAMVLGEVFLRHFYSVFDRGDGSEEHARIGFAPAAHGPEVEDRLRGLTKSQPAFGATNSEAITPMP